MPEKFGEDTKRERKDLAEQLSAESSHEKRRALWKKIKLTAEYQDVRERFRAQSVIQDFVESFVKSHEPVDSGTEGDIYRLDVSEITPDVIEAFAQSGVELGDGVAAKMLKIYHPGRAEKEWLLQAEAHDVLKHHPESAAQVPATIGPIEVTLSDDEEKKGELIIMDYVDGKDISRLLYEFVVRTHGMEDEIPYLSSMNALKFRAGNVLGFAEPANQSAENVERVYEDNRRKVYDYAIKHGFAIHPSLTKKVQEAFRLLEEANIFHNDDHERNVMIEGDPASEDAQIYLIDFGKAGRTSLGSELATNVTKWMRRLHGAGEQYTEDLERLMAKIDDLPKYRAIYDAFLEDLRDNQAQLHDRLSNPDLVRGTLAMLLKAIRQEELSGSRESIRFVLERYRDSHTDDQQVNGMVDAVLRELT